MFLRMTVQSAAISGKTVGVNSDSMSSRTGVTWTNGVVLFLFALRSGRGLHGYDTRCKEVEVDVSVSMGLY